MRATETSRVTAVNAESSWGRRATFIRDIRVVFGLATLLLVIAMAAFASSIAPFNPNSLALQDNLSPPSLQPLRPSEAPHIAGTDLLGRDVFSRVVHGARISIGVAAVTSLLALFIGVATGLVAGYFGGVLGQILMRIADVQLAFPFMVLAIVVIVAVGPGAAAVTVVVALWGWVPFARVTRAEVLVVRETEYVAAAIAVGAGPWRVMLRHVLPNVSSSILVTATFFVGVVLLSEGALSFIGLGVQPPDPSWGQMIAEGRSMISTASWVSVAPGIPLSLSVLAVNVLGDALTDALDPRSRGV